MFDRYLIEVGDEPAGILVQAGQDFAFHAVGAPYGALDGVRFPDPASARHAAARLVSRRTRPATLLPGFPGRPPQRLPQRLG